MRVALATALLLYGTAHAASVILEWDEPTDVTNVATYQLERKDGPCAAAGDWVQIGEVPVGTATLADNQLDVNKFYCWRAFSFNPDHGRSDPSEVVEYRVPFAAKPVAPARVRVAPSL
jgi:hypothetical protein